MKCRVKPKAIHQLTFQITNGHASIYRLLSKLTVNRNMWQKELIN